MSLDVFDPTPVLQNAQQNLAQDLPAGFGEAFDVAARYGMEWKSALGTQIARERAMNDYIQDVRDKTGETLPNPAFLVGGGSLDDFNSAQAKIVEKYPNVNYLTPLAPGDIDAMGQRRMAKAHDDAAAFQSRETTWGGTAGSFLGSQASLVADPVMLATLPLGGVGEAGIALRALEFAGIAGGSEAVNAGLTYKSHEAAVPGSSKEIPGAIVGAALTGGVLGGALGALGKWLGAGEKVLPTTIRDDVNAGTSEAQFAAVNPFPTAAGEAAARDAHVDATTSMLRGEPVRSGDNFSIAHVDDYALAANVDRLPGSVEKLSELQLGEIANGVTDIEQKAVKAQSLLDLEDTKTVKGEVANLDRSEILGKMRAEIDGITQERSAIDDKISAIADPETAARLKAISDDLQAPGLSSGKAAELEQERATITETMAASADRDGHAVASLQQEAKALDKLLGRRTAEADRLQKVHDQATSVSAAKRSSIEGQRQTIETTLTSHKEMLGTEMRRAIARLATEGYGVRLERSEAQDLADFVLSQRDNAAPALSHVTETLVSKAREARAARLGEAGERFLRPLTFDERPAVERFAVRPGDHVEPAPAAAAKPDPKSPFSWVRIGGVSASDMTPPQVARLAAEPATQEAVLHNFEHIAQANPDMEFTTQVRQPDGSYQFVTQKLSDVMGELDGWEAAAKEIEACAVGGALEAAE